MPDQVSNNSVPVEDASSSAKKGADDKALDEVTNAASKILQAGSSESRPIYIKSVDPKKESKVALVSIAVAILSLAVSIHGSLNTDRQIAQAVRPLLGHQTNALPGGAFSLGIINNGSGPAIVENVKVRIDNHPWQSALHPNWFTELDSQPWYLAGNYPPLLPAGCWTFTKGASIPVSSNGFSMIAAAPTQGTNVMAPNEFIFNHVQVSITYTTTAGENWTYDCGGTFDNLQ